MVTGWLKKRWAQELLLAAALLTIAMGAVAAFTWWVAVTFLTPFIDLLTAFVHAACGT